MSLDVGAILQLTELERVAKFEPQIQHFNEECPVGRGVIPIGAGLVDGGGSLGSREGGWSGRGAGSFKGG